MSVTIRPYVNGGWEVDIRVLLPDGTLIRERKKAPATSKSAAQRWAEARERVLLVHGKPKPGSLTPRPTTRVPQDHSGPSKLGRSGAPNHQLTRDRPITPSVKIICPTDEEGLRCPACGGVAMSRAEKRSLGPALTRVCQNCDALISISWLTTILLASPGFAGIAVMAAAENETLAILGGLAGGTIMFGLLFRFWPRVPLVKRGAFFGPPPQPAGMRDGEAEGLKCPSCGHQAMSYAAKFRLGPLAQRPCQYCGVNVSVWWVSGLFFVPAPLVWVWATVFGYTLLTSAVMLVTVCLTVILSRKYWIRVPLVRR